MVRARLAIATLCLLTSCAGSAAHTTSNTAVAPTVAIIPPYRVALARCLDAASPDLPDRAITDHAAIQSANQACDRAAAELRSADLAGGMRTDADVLRRELVSLDAALVRAGQQISSNEFDEAARSDLLTAIAKFQAAASQIL